jgi:hypothetical protein
MAQRIIRQVIDDLDQTEIGDGEGEHIEFTFRGTTYELDLSRPNVAKFEKALAPFIKAASEASEAAPKSAGSSRRSSSRRGRTKKAAARDLSVVRVWAAENGYAVNSRGRVPAEVLQAYDAAQ